MNCDLCGIRPAMHSVSRPGDRGISHFEFCCECYIAEGNPPADWHRDCMAAYKRREPQTRPAEEK